MELSFISNDFSSYTTNILFFFNHQKNTAIDSILIIPLANYDFELVFEIENSIENL